MENRNQHTWKDTVYNCFNPFEPVSGDKITAWFVERQDSPLEQLENAFGYGRLAPKILLLGQRGCGKTSELFKLISKLKEKYFTVYVDAYASLELDSTSRTELLFFLGAGVYSAAKEAGLKIEDHLWKELVSSLSTVVREDTRQTDISLDPMGLLRGVVATAGTAYPPFSVIAAATDGIRFSLGLTKKQVERLEIGPYLKEISHRVNAIIQATEGASGKKVLLIADGLERITSEEQSRQLFDKSRYLTSLRCDAIFTVPVALYANPGFREADNEFEHAQLPNIRIYEKGNRQQAYQPGYVTLREVVTRRLDSLGLSIEIIFETGVVDYLIQMSGGVLRDLVHLVRRAVILVENNESRIGMFHAQEAVRSLQMELAQVLYEEDYIALRKILKSGSVERNDPAQLQLLWSRYIVNYHNGGFWRDVHPLILSIVEKHFEGKSEEDKM